MSTLSTFYNDVFCGTEIPYAEFSRIEAIARDVIYDVCNKKPTDEQMQTAEYQKAICYEMEMLYQQGGIDAIVGFAEGLNGITSESLGGYSVSGGANGKEAMLAKGGIPASSLAIAQLRRLGLMSRWLYSGVKRRGES